MTVPQAFCLTLVGTLLLSSVQAGTFDVGPDTDPLSDQRIMVRLFPGAELAEFINTFEDDHARLGLTLSPLDTIESRQTHLLQLAPPGLDEKILDLVQDDLGNYPGFLVWSEFLSEGTAVEGDAFGLLFFVPDGEEPFSAQYVTEMFDLSATHQSSTGAGTVIAVLDTGVDAESPVVRPGHGTAAVEVAQQSSRGVAFRRRS